MEIFNGLFAMDCKYRDPTPPIVYACNLYTISTFSSRGRAISPSGKQCNYLSINQTLGTVNSSVSVLIPSDYAEDIYLKNANLSYTVKWKLTSRIDNPKDPNLRIINVVNSVKGYEAFDTQGNKIRFRYPVIKNGKTCDRFTLGGYNSIFVIYSESDDFILNFTIKAKDNLYPNPYVPGIYKINGECVLKIKPFEGDLIRYVSSKHLQYAEQIRNEYLSYEYKSCSSTSVMATDSLLEPWKVICQADIQQLTNAEKLCEVAIEIALVAAIMLSVGAAGEALGIAIEKIVAGQLILGVHVAVKTSNIITNTDALFAPIEATSINNVSIPYKDDLKV